jgi:sucrose-6-phosphate hydrolase SacC (GH32 family)
MVFYKGQYHLFFQYNPEGRAWGNMTWGHAVSPDMVHWTQRPDAIERDALGTIFSGSAVVDWHNTSGFQQGDEKPLVALYTAAGGTSPESKGRKFTQCLAYSADAGRTWTKYEGNPVVGHIRAENRDPKVIWHEPSKRWVMALYLEGNDFTFYNSPDLKRWTHLQDIRVQGTDECPDFFPMPIEGEPGVTKWVFTGANARYLVGDFDGSTFTPDGGNLTSTQSDYGAFYAVQSFSDVPDGRRIQIGWMRGGSYPRMPFNQQMSFPTAITLRRTPEGFRLFRAPVKEIESIRLGEPVTERDRTVGTDGVRVEALGGDLLDVDLTLEPGDAKDVGVRVRGETIRYCPTDGTLSVGTVRAPVRPADGTLRLRVLVDRTSIEVFANEGAVSLHACYVPGGDAGAAPLTLFAEGGDAKLVSLVGHRLRSTWTTPAPAQPAADEASR